MAVTAIKPRNAVESLREIAQDIIVPDMKAIKMEVESHRRETKSDIESLRNEVKTLGDSLRSEVKALGDSLRTEMRLRDEKQTQALQAISDEVGYAMDVFERLAVLEDRGSRA
jgi:ferritin-like metal-binding protein YciE